MRARLAIAVSRQYCDLREVVLRDKPPEMLSASPKATVPVLVLPDGKVIEESLDIMHWALAQFDPEEWLAPMGSARDELLALISDNDGPFKHHLDRYKYTTRYEGADSSEHRAEGAQFLRQLDDRLAARPYLMGDRFSIADAAIFPFVRQFANADRIWFDASDMPHLQRWLGLNLTSPRFAHIMKKYPKWDSGTPGITFPDTEDLPGGP